MIIPIYIPISILAVVSAILTVVSFGMVVLAIWLKVGEKISPHAQKATPADIRVVASITNPITSVTTILVIINRAVMGIYLKQGGYAPELPSPFPVAYALSSHSHAATKARPSCGWW
jgi:hypothetical protein